MCAEHNISEPTYYTRSSYYYASQRSAERVKLEGRIVELSEKHPRYGYWRVTALLRRDGQEVNAKRMQRLGRFTSRPALHGRMPISKASTTNCATSA